MILKVSFNSYGHEIPVSQFPPSLQALRTVIGNEVGAFPDDLVLEFFDIEQEKMQISDDLDFGYFADLYSKKPCLIFAELDPRSRKNSLVASQVDIQAPTPTPIPGQQPAQPDFFGTRLFRLVDKLEVMASSKVTDLIDNFSTNLHQLPTTKRQRLIDFRQLKCLNCEQIPANQKAYICIYCNMYSLCTTCEAKIQHKHPMALVTGGFDSLLSDSLATQRILAEARSRRSHYCKVRILRQLFGTKMTDMERRDLVWRHHTLTNDEFFEAMLGLMEEKVAVK